MKRNKDPLYLLLAILCVWCPLLIAAWNKDKPSSSTSLRDSNPEILANWSALQTAIGQDHDFDSSTQTGEHEQVKFLAPISTPTNAANKAWLYGKDVSSVIEFHWLDESGNELQMTSGGDLYSSAGLTVTGASTFNSSITLGAGDDLIGSATSDITFNTNKFTVAGATGNTLVAGTLDVAGNIDPTTYETTNGGFLNSDTMTGVADNTVASSDSIKNYVDAHGVVQVVNTQTGAVNSSATAFPVDDTIPQNTEGFELMTLAITPTSATNKLKIEIIVELSPTAIVWGGIGLFQDTTANALAAQANHFSENGRGEILTLTHYMTSGTTSETTFKVRGGCTSGTTTFNGSATARYFGGVMASSITITELKN